MAWTDTELLRALANASDGPIAPSAADPDIEPSYSTVVCHFDSWQKGVIRAGLRPLERRPLTDEQFFRFYNAATNRSRPADQLTALLLQFTGLPRTMLESLNSDWVTDRAGDTVVAVPAGHLEQDTRWVFRLPESFRYQGESHYTTLPGLINWALDNGITPHTQRHAAHIVYEVAKDATLTNRLQTTLTVYGQVPQVRPKDLQATGGVRMARNGVPAQRIRRHLGIDHTGCEATVDEFFLWCQVHDDDFSHPDWEPVEPVLDPV